MDENGHENVLWAGRLTFMKPNGKKNVKKQAIKWLLHSIISDIIVAVFSALLIVFENIDLAEKKAAKIRVWLKK